MMNYRVVLVLVLTMCLLLAASSCQDMEQFDFTADSDGDGWTNEQETAAGTDPEKVDTDDDEYWDPHDPNPLNPEIPVSKGMPDTDSAPEPETVPQPTTPSPEEEEPELPSETEDTSPEVAPVSAEAAALEEFHKIQEAVKVMMSNNNLTQLEHPVTTPTNDMRGFPDDATKHGIAGVGYVLYLHDFNGDGKPDTNYIPFKFAEGTYRCDIFGNVTQVTTGNE